MKCVYIMRGLVGSGKSTIASILADGLSMNSNGVKILSADNLRIVDGVYQFIPELEVHVWEEFERLYHEAIDDEIESIIIDNTNLKFVNFESYIEYAVENGYTTHEIIVGNFDTSLSFQRCSHDVPMNIIDKMSQVFEFKRVS